MADLQEGMQRYILLIFVLSASEVVCAEQTCGSLVFPTEFDSSVLHQPEHTQVVIPFEESDEGCTDELDDTDNKIIVEKKTSAGVFTNLCTIRLVNGSCSTDSTGDADCVCLEEKGRYEFRKYMTREDTDLTLAFASSKGAKTKLITFDITCKTLHNIWS
ncbi:hypothetical protein BaRGS_00018441 [Batillaria attramentaria]|uniref:Secreted protein n=1 Tax=Batillaria attramentaria TaxID=370345 RepID=A0ABD0KSW7_9CAEN